MYLWKLNGFVGLGIMNWLLVLQSMPNSLLSQIHDTTDTIINVWFKHTCLALRWYLTELTVRILVGDSCGKIVKKCDFFSLQSFWTWVFERHSVAFGAAIFQHSLPLLLTPIPVRKKLLHKLFAHIQNSSDRAAHFCVSCKTIKNPANVSRHSGDVRETPSLLLFANYLQPWEKLRFWQ